MLWLTTCISYLNLIGYELIEGTSMHSTKRGGGQSVLWIGKTAGKTPIGYQVFK